MLIQQIIDAALNEILIGTYRAHFNALDGALTDSDTVVTFAYALSGLGANAYIEVDQELMYVVPGGVNETAKTFTVIRGARGTVAASHLDGAGVNINPRFPRVAILNTMVEEARSWPISLFQVAAVEVAGSMVDTAIDVAAETGFDDIIRVIQVWRLSTRPTSSRWVRMSGWRFERGMLGIGSADVFLPHTVSQGVRLLVSRPFNDVGAWDEDFDIADSGMPDSMGDILKYGAAWRLTTGRESRRLFTEVESEGRAAADVPATAALTLGRQLKMLRDARVGEEILRLRSYYGFRGIG